MAQEVPSLAAVFGFQTGARADPIGNPVGNRAIWKVEHPKTCNEERTTGCGDWRETCNVRVAFQRLKLKGQERASWDIGGYLCSLGGLFR
jgi:hypothetical protein